jgi:hypothetical protein
MLTNRRQEDEEMKEQQREREWESFEDTPAEHGPGASALLPSASQTQTSSTLLDGTSWQQVQHNQTPCSSSRSSLLLPTTVASNVWGRLPASTRQLMQEALSCVDSDFELDESCLQQSPATDGGAPQASGRRNHKLDVVKVMMIFQAKQATPLAAWDRDLSSRLAAQYDVTPKAVRDIWNRRTWKHVTNHL